MTRFHDLEKSREIRQQEFSLDHEKSFLVSLPFLEIRDLIEQILDLVSNNEIIKISISQKNEIIIHIFLQISSVQKFRSIYIVSIWNICT